jgi:hypothetical protein
MTKNQRNTPQYGIRIYLDQIRKVLGAAAGRTRNQQDDGIHGYNRGAVKDCLQRAIHPGTNRLEVRNLGRTTGSSFRW